MLSRPRDSSCLQRVVVSCCARIVTNGVVAIGLGEHPVSVPATHGAVGAPRRIAVASVTWISYAEALGVDFFAQRFWREAGSDPRGQLSNMTSRQGMCRMLLLADQTRADTLIDRAIFHAFWSRRHPGMQRSGADPSSGCC